MYTTISMYIYTIYTFISVYTYTIYTFISMYTYTIYTFISVYTYTIYTFISMYTYTMYTLISMYTYTVYTFISMYTYTMYTFISVYTHTMHTFISMYTYTMYTFISMCTYAMYTFISMYTYTMYTFISMYTHTMYTFISMYTHTTDTIISMSYVEKGSKTLINNYTFISCVLLYWLSSALTPSTAAAGFGLPHHFITNYPAPQFRTNSRLGPKDGRTAQNARYPGNVGHEINVRLQVSTHPRASALHSTLSFAYCRAASTVIPHHPPRSSDYNKYLQAGEQCLLENEIALGLQILVEDPMFVSFS